MANLSSKESLRRHYKSVRSQLNQKRRSEAEASIMKILYPALTSFHKILSFASFSDEIDLWPLNERLAQEGRLYLPRMDHSRLLPFQVNGIEVQLIKSKHGVLEPNPSVCQKIDSHHLDCILVPGLCFDSKYYRLGYGLGHFDFFLKDLPTTPKLGIGFREQKIEELPVESHDIALTKLYLF